MLSDAARATAVGADICEIRLDKLWVIEELNKLFAKTPFTRGFFV